MIESAKGRETYRDGDNQREKIMGFTSFLKSPKKELEQHEVPDAILSAKFDGNYALNGDQEVNIMDDLERILGINDGDEDQKLTKGKTNVGQLNWEFVDDWDEFRNGDEDEEEDLDDEEERESKLFSDPCFFEEEGYNNNLLYNNGHNEFLGSTVVKREHVGFWDDDYSRVSLNLSLNYQQVMDAWSDRGSLWADDYSLSTATNGYMGEVPVMEEERARREASVMRYKEKRQTRLFSKKIRYEVRKLNADKRPRLKGRFVKRVS